MDLVPHPHRYLYAIGNPRADWRFKTEPVPGLSGRAINYARGKVIGGCTAINAMIYMHGQAHDYDTWRQIGLSGWGWDDVLPYFLRHEDHHGGKADLHAAGGVALTVARHDAADGLNRIDDLGETIRVDLAAQGGGVLVGGGQLGQVGIAAEEAGIDALRLLGHNLLLAAACERPQVGGAAEIAAGAMGARSRGHGRRRGPAR